MNCDDSFNIVLIDDKTFSKLIPNWKTDMSFISDPIKKYVRELGMAKLIWNYGGMKVPASFLCFQNLVELWERGTMNDKMFVCENVNSTNTSMTNPFHPDFDFFGANPKHETLFELIQYCEHMISVDYTDAHHFLDGLNKKIKWKAENNKIILIDASYMGVKDVDEEPILVDNLLSEDYIKIYKNAYGIWIPDFQILNRTKYEYYARLNSSQLLESDCILSKYILLSNTPEGFTGQIVKNKYNKPKNWVNFWKTDLLQTVPLYAPRPLGVAAQENVKLFYKE